MFPLSYFRNVFKGIKRLQEMFIVELLTGLTSLKRVQDEENCVGEKKKNPTNLVNGSN